MIDLFLSLSTELKMIASLVVLFVGSVGWSHKDKLLGLFSIIPRRTDSKPGPHELLDSYLMLIERAKESDDVTAIENLRNTCHLIYEPRPFSHLPVSDQSSIPMPGAK